MGEMIRYFSINKWNINIFSNYRQFYLRLEAHVAVIHVRRSETRVDLNRLEEKVHSSFSYHLICDI